MFRPASSLCAVAFAALAVALPARLHAEPARCAGASQAIPARVPQARGASRFLADIAGLTEHERDDAIRDELLTGNMPRFLRQVLPVTVSARLDDGTMSRLTLCVMPDYLSLGSNDDFLRVPMGLPAALAVASRFGFTLPTRRIVDLVYGHAAVRLRPQPLPANERMRSTAAIRFHDHLVEQQRREAGAALGLLTAGTKKDLVLTPRLWEQPGRVAIYGWHRRPGEPIQPLSLVHGERYADYSHGVRLVGERVWVDGAPRSIVEVLEDPRLAPLLSDEGPLPQGGVASVLQQRNPR
jgi:hypothetical protein